MRIHKNISILTVGLFTVLTSTAQNYKFDFRQEKSTKEGYIKVTPTDLFSESKGYGYDLQPVSTSSDTAPFFFSVQIPDGNYRITVLLGSGKNTRNIKCFETNFATLFL